MRASSIVLIALALSGCSSEKESRLAAEVSALETELLETKELLEAQTERSLDLEGQLAVQEKIKESDISDAFPPMSVD